MMKAVAAPCTGGRSFLGDTNPLPHTCAQARTQLYARFSADFERRGLDALAPGASASQGMALSALFTKDSAGRPQAKLQAPQAPDCRAACFHAARPIVFALR